MVRSMTQVGEMLRSYPADLGKVDRELLARCIEECLACAQACTACADACMSESDEAMPMLRKCMRSCADCADVCDMTGRILSRHTEYDANITRAMLDACATVCRSCADEGERHAQRHEHCRICAEACRRCEQACHDHERAGLIARGRTERLSLQASEAQKWDLWRIAQHERAT